VVRLVAEYRGHRPIISVRTGTAGPAVNRDLVAALSHIPVSDISDAVGRLYTMGSWMRPLYDPMRRVIGSALTVRMPPGDNWAVFGALNLIKPGDVLVIDWMQYNEGSGSGANFVAEAMDRGLVGVVIDGSWRDVEELIELDFPIIGRGIVSFSPRKRELGEVNVPVNCGAVIVEPGDLVVGDGGGVVVVPQHAFDAIARLTMPGRRPGHEAKRKSLENINTLARKYQELSEEEVSNSHD
jgi:4-hydroxy-4-methyl-2-oxoglutarate aldolase